MNRPRIRSIGLILFVALAGFAAPAARSAPVNLPSHSEPYFVDSFEHDNLGKSIELVFRGRIVAPGAYWLRLHFSAYELGKGSFVRIVSLTEEGATQRLEAKDLPMWGHSSAYFNGDAVELELWTAPGDEQVFFRIETITVGEWPELPEEKDGESTTDICGGADGRSNSGDRRVGRLSFVSSGAIVGSCTTFIAPNGAMLSAGHCAASGLSTHDLVEFNVPDSSSGGVWNFSHPDDQYPLDLTSVQWSYTGPIDWGNDWSLFAVLPNSNTLLLPPQAQDGYTRLTREIPIDGHAIRVTGYGQDTDAGEGHLSYTLQTAVGSYQGEVQDGERFYHKHRVDTDAGNSGGPILNYWDMVEYAFGIHTSGGCGIPEAPYLDTNKGTSFEHAPLGEALNDFLDPDTVFVDTASAASKEDGTIFAPCLSVSLCAGWVLEGGVVSIAKGYYDEPALFETACTVLAPVGPVVIGEPAP